MAIGLKDTISNILFPYRPRRLAVGEIDYMEAVPEEYLRTVVFLCVDEQTESGTKRVPKATGFLVRVPIEGSINNALDYVVTARHCIHEASSYRQIYIRENRKVGKFIEFPTKIEDWYLHDNADVAAIPLFPSALPKGIKPTDIDQASLKISDFVGGGPEYKFVGDTPFGIREIQPRVGHQIYFLGLFTEHYGTERNLPIARFGHISRMPDSLEIEINNTYFHIVAYLVEFQSWGGHSGSPVFFLYPMVVEDQISLQFVEGGQKQNVTACVNLVWLTSFMGLISGHYDISKEAQKTGDILGEIQVKLNSGIALVTPAEAVTQLLMREDLMEHRKKLSKTAELNRPMPGE